MANRTLTGRRGRAGRTTIVIAHGQNRGAREGRRLGSDGGLGVRERRRSDRRFRFADRTSGDNISLLTSRGHDTACLQNSRAIDGAAFRRLPNRL